MTATFYTQLRAARVRQKLTRPEMAEAAGVTAEKIERIETGSHPVCLTMHERARLAAFYGVEMAAFDDYPLSQKNKPPKEKPMLEDKVVLTKEELQQLGLPGNPFPDRPRSGAVFMWPELAKLMQGIDEALQDNGMVAVVGPSGAGKSTLLQQLRENLERSGDVIIVELASADRGRLTDAVVEKTLLQALKVPARGLNNLSANDRFIKLKQLLTKEVKGGTRVILMGDDFHDASPAVLKVLRRLREADPRYYLFGAIFAGQLDLASALESDELREVGGRTQMLRMPQLGGGTAGQKRAQNYGHAFISWHFAQLGLNETDIARYFTADGAHAVAEMAEYPLWCRNLAVRALKKVAPLKRPVDAVVLTKLSR